jgi:CheY-like chemotaxis protein
MTQRPIEILLVEDSPSDVWLTREALEMGAVPKRINVVSNGEQALDFLHRRGPYANAVRPDIILLDLNLPRVSGLDVLRRIKADPDQRTITVIVLSTSDSVLDVNAAYDLNANCYVVKPLDYEKFTMTIRGIEEFWMRFASLPGFTPPRSSETGSGEKGASADGGRKINGRPQTHAVPIRWRRPRRTRVISGAFVTWRHRRAASHRN